VSAIKRGKKAGAVCLLAESEDCKLQRVEQLEVRGPRTSGDRREEYHLGKGGVVGIIKSNDIGDSVNYKDKPAVEQKSRTKRARKKAHRRPSGWFQGVEVEKQKKGEPKRSRQRIETGKAQSADRFGRKRPHTANAGGFTWDCKGKSSKPGAGDRVSELIREIENMTGRGKKGGG